MLHKESRLLRVGVLGAGPIAQAAHFDACRKARNAELYAICDSAEDLVTRMVAIHQPRVAYLDYNDLLADAQVEAVIIATADEFHISLAQQAIAAGKHVLIEKPLGVNVEQCETLRDDLHGTELVVQVGHNRRFDPGIAFAQRFAGERIGPIFAIKTWYYDSVERYTMTDNLQPPPIISEQARRPTNNPKANKQRYFLLTHGSHLVDTTRFLAGEIESVHARFVERGGAHCWFVQAAFVTGSVGHLDLIVPIQGDFEEGFQIFCEKGSATGRTYLPWYHMASYVECFAADDQQYHRPLGANSHSYKLQVEGFADTILHKLPMLGASIDDGIASIRALVAIARSVKQAEWVRLADVTGGI